MGPKGGAISKHYLSNYILNSKTLRRLRLGWTVLQLGRAILIFHNPYTLECETFVTHSSHSF